MTFHVLFVLQFPFWLQPLLLSFSVRLLQMLACHAWHVPCTWCSSAWNSLPRHLRGHSLYLLQSPSEWVLLTQPFKIIISASAPHFLIPFSATSSSSAGMTIKHTVNLFVSLMICLPPVLNRTPHVRIFIHCFTPYNLEQYLAPKKCSINTFWISQSFSTNRYLFSVPIFLFIWAFLCISSLQQLLPVSDGLSNYKLL